MEIYAVVYGENFKFSTEKSIFYDAETDKRISDFVFSYYVIIYGDKYHLVDTGFRNKNIAHENEINLFYNPKIIDSLVDDRTLEAILITHDHFDHTGNLDLFKSCGLYIQQYEYEAMLSNPDNAMRLDSKKIMAFKDSIEINPHISMKHIGGHTKGSSAVKIKTGNREFIILGDECYRQENLLDQRPVGNVYDVDKNREFIGCIRNKDIIPLINHDISNLDQSMKMNDFVYRVFHDSYKSQKAE